MKRLEIINKELKEYKKQKIISELTPVKEFLKLLEQKYQCSFYEFVTRIHNEPESFEKWDDYIEWKWYQRKLEKLEKDIFEQKYSK
ncbi:hypothetical protein [Candidatus Contubernalis alkaliaceticus]|uniref:hypothetical protein n=1 Tax=Candidatus Contubernalis alkaliaceticus TaxID=338645 RepID=UPI001F4C3716|nr:hypothetical protein [Candidatus Contubernalis alkalaceticus]UNC93571.1 hypothetical protein HUE98_16705 [Candidatus Contubernalis alkalaceticus]